MAAIGAGWQMRQGPEVLWRLPVPGQVKVQLEGLTLQMQYQCYDLLYEQNHLGR